MKRVLCICLTCVLLLFSLSAVISESAFAQQPSFVLKASEIQTKFGERTTVTATLTNIPNPEAITVTGKSIDSSWRVYTDENGEWKYEISTPDSPAEFVEKSVEGNTVKLVFEGGFGSDSREFTVALPSDDGTEIILATVTVTNTGISENEKEQAGAVQYIGDRNFFKYDNENVYVLNFSFKDKDENRIAAPAYVDMRIENDNGVTVYEQRRYVNTKNFGTWTSSWYGDRYLASIRIKPEEITEGNITTGKVFFTVYLPGGIYFSESQVSASELPTYDATRDCKLVFTEFSKDNPLTLKYRSYSELKLIGLDYEFVKRSNGNVDLKLSFTGEKTYDSQGANHSGTCYIGYKLYDPEGYVLQSGTISTTSLSEGEKFRNAEKTFYDLIPGEYKLSLIDVD